MLLRRILPVLTAWLCLFPSPVFAKDLVYSGSLEAVTHNSVTLRLDDGLIAFALLGGIEPDALAAKYRLGDRMRMECVPVGAKYVAEEKAFFQLKARRVDFVRAPTDVELKVALASRARTVDGNLLLVPEGVSVDSVAAPQEDVPGLAQVRAAAKAYFASLPDYVADETTTCFYSNAHPPVWRKNDILQAEVVFTGSTETRRHLLMGGVAWKGDFSSMPGIKPAGGFAERLRAVFAENCAIRFQLQAGSADSPGRLRVYSFVTPPDSCLGAQVSVLRYYPGYSGHIYFDADTNAIMSLDIRTTGFPEAFSVSLVEERITWAFATVGTVRHLLPVSAERTKADGSFNFLVRQEFGNYRHFESSSSVVFDSAAKQ